MRIFNHVIDWQLSLSDALAIAAGEHRAPDPVELAACIAELARLIGKKEASSPEWTRRLCVLRDSGTAALLVNHAILCADLGMAVNDPHVLVGVPVALPLAEAVALLQSPENPELELVRRQRFVDETRAKARQRAETADAEGRAKAQAAAKAKVERAEFRADAWEGLTEVQRFVARLALAVASADPSLAATIRGVVRESLAGDDFPRAQWWTGITGDSQASGVARGFGPEFDSNFSTCFTEEK